MKKRLFAMVLAVLMMVSLLPTSVFAADDVKEETTVQQEEIVEEEEIESITFIGLCTDICVISNVIIAKAFFPEVPVFVDANCCAGVSVESHENALKAMEVCQVNVIR